MGIAPRGERCPDCKFATDFVQPDRIVDVDETHHRSDHAPARQSSPGGGLVSTFGACSPMRPGLVSTFGACSPMRPGLVSTFGACSPVCSLVRPCAAGGGFVR